MDLQAPSRWRCVDFISDLHLHVSDTKTFQALGHYVSETAADALFLLGDLFEVWVGDDALAVEACFEQQCMDLLRTAGRRLDLYIMHGNRDFLMGSALAQACHATLLDDPTVLVYAGERWLLSHGDAWCVADTQYMQFRTQVRSPDWQIEFMQRPLAQRLELARSMRAQSEARKRTDTSYADVDTPTANTLLAASNANHMIHGHTHRPARHAMASGRERLVLSDWDCLACPPRAEVLRVRNISIPGLGYTVERIPPAMAAAGTADLTPRTVD